MILRLVCKLLYGGGVTVYACCSTAFIWEQVADITVVCLLVLA